MIVIDGGYGEGGGQIIRTATALSVATGESIRVINIRKNRKPAGLRPQHIAVIKALSKLTGSVIEDLYPGQTEFVFQPNISAINHKISVDIGTAGSTALLAYTLLQAIVSYQGCYRFEITGGTETLWCPTIDYFENVTLAFIKYFGLATDIRIVSRGYYPRGGGKIILSVENNYSEDMPPFRKEGFETDFGIYGISVVRGLKEDIASRQADAFIKIIKRYFPDFDSENIRKDVCQKIDNGGSPGTSLTVWTDKNYIGCVGIGEKGKKAEFIGNQVAIDFLKEVKSGLPFDTYSSDQVVSFIPYIAKSSVIVKKTSHAITNLYVIRHFYKNLLKIREKGNYLRVESVKAI